MNCGDPTNENTGSPSGPSMFETMPVPSLLLYALIGGVIGCAFFGIVIVVALSLLETGGDTTLTPTTATEDNGTTIVTVIPPLSALHPAAQVLTATAEAAGTVAGTSSVDQAATELKAQGAGGSLAQVFDILKNHGLGDIPIGKILQDMSPYTLNQLQNMGQKMLSPGQEAEKPKSNRERKLEH